MNVGEICSNGIVEVLCLIQEGYSHVVFLLDFLFFLIGKQARHVSSMFYEMLRKALPAIWRSLLPKTPHHIHTFWEQKDSLSFTCVTATFHFQISVPPSLHILSMRESGV